MAERELLQKEATVVTRVASECRVEKVMASEGMAAQDFREATKVRGTLPPG
jgi:hypothetical protein